MMSSALIYRASGAHQELRLHSYCIPSDYSRQPPHCLALWSCMLRWVPLKLKSQSSLLPAGRHSACLQLSIEAQQFWIKNGMQILYDKTRTVCSNCCSPSLSMPKSQAFCFLKAVYSPGCLPCRLVAWLPVCNLPLDCSLFITRTAADEAHI